MRIQFYKYQGTGNDFIMIDGRKIDVNFSSSEISSICDRRFGVGADGIIILKNHSDCDFEMVYYNADGTQSFCGNGSRCAQAFAKKLGIITNDSKFYAIDGFHEGRIMGENYATKMGDVEEVEILNGDYFIHTGSPHYIQYVEDADTVDVFGRGRSIRNSPPYKNEGTNVNFVSIHDEMLKVRTYERGVEDETFSCGTGVTAAAISYLVRRNLFLAEVPIQTKGGELTIALNKTAESSFEDIWLIGPAKEVFEGELVI